MRFLHTIPWYLLANFGHCGLFRDLNTWMRGRRQRKRFRSAVQHESKIPFHQASGSTHIHLRGCRWDWWPKNAPQLQTGFEDLWSTQIQRMISTSLQISKNSAWEDLTCPPQVLHVKRKLASFVLHETQTLKHPLQDLQVVVRVHFGTPVGSISSFTAGVSSFHSWHQANKCTNCLSVEKS